MSEKDKEFESKLFLAFDVILISAIVICLIFYFSLRSTLAIEGLALASFLGLMPVIMSASKALYKRTVSVDLLAALALIFSLFSKEWSSAAFITLMLAFARIFDHVTETRAKKIIRSLMKYHVERVRIRNGESFKDIHISEVKKGDEVVVESGERMPVDGIVISGTAEIDESSLTGESELVSKKVGDKVHTATVNDSGSLIVRAEKVGADTTLSRIIKLVDEASRDKGKAEKVADRFTQWYIVLTLVVSILLYLFQVPHKIILAILLVVCADDIAVAVPLGFTAAISHAARRGVIVKGSIVFEQLARMKYMLTDKTGTLTKGKPKVVDVKTYGNISVDKVLEYAGMGSSESGHMVSRAVLEYLAEKKMKIHVPHEFEEISGQGTRYSHNADHLLLGRLSFIEHEKTHISDEIKKDITTEKAASRGVVILALNGEVIGLISYRDELRPHVTEIIADTKTLGIKEWHMLTGDNEAAAKTVAHELGITHYHANMTPESKVEFIRDFEKEHSMSGKGKGTSETSGQHKGENGKRNSEANKGTVGYMGDGVNDAASLALADVSIAMGGIGSDAAIEAADITIMKDHLDRLPETIRIARKVRRVMWQNFAIWALTNGVGLALVLCGFIGPAGAATYNFLTDFLPIGNALRAGRK